MTHRAVLNIRHGVGIAGEGGGGVVVVTGESGWMEVQSSKDPIVAKVVRSIQIAL